MAVTDNMEKMRKNLVNLALVTYIEKSLILFFVLDSLTLYGKGESRISPVFILLVIILSVEVVNLTTSLAFSAHSTNGKSDTEAVSKEEKKTESSEEKQKRNNLQEKTNSGADEDHDDLNPTSQIPLTEHKTILKKIKTKCEENSKSAIDKYTKELEEKAEEDKSKYREERAEWEEIRYSFESEIKSLRSFADSVLSINPSFEPYLTDQHATNPVGINQFATNLYGTHQYGTNPHCTNPYCRSPTCTNQYGTNSYRTNPNGTYQYGTNAFAHS